MKHRHVYILHMQKEGMKERIISGTPNRCNTKGGKEGSAVQAESENKIRACLSNNYGRSDQSLKDLLGTQVPSCSVCT